VSAERLVLVTVTLTSSARPFRAAWWLCGMESSVAVESVRGMVPGDVSRVAGAMAWALTTIRW
jgi:hypothetical protein